MNNGRIWCVVKPSVGLPLFLGSVAVIAITVHAAVLTNTTWFADYWQGGKKAAPTAQLDTKGAAPVVLRTEDGKAAFAINVVPAGDSSSYVIKVDRLPGELASAAAEVK